MGEPAKNPDLDALRGIAIGLVYAFHALGNAVLTGPAWVGTPLWFSLVSSGHTGVSLFFVLSAFLLSRPLFAGTPPGSGVDWRRFVRRRVLRIMPMYALTVLVSTALCAHAPADMLRALPHLTFLASYPPWASLLVPYPANNIPIDGTWWSLRAEVQFYALLPLVALAMRTRATGVVAAGAALATYVAFVTSHLPPMSPAAVWSLTGSVVGRGPVFACGMLAAWLVERHGAAVQRACDRLGRIGSTALLIAVLAVLCALLRWTEGINAWVLDLPPRVVWHAGEGILWTMVLLLVLRAPLLAKALVSNPAWVWLGERSYSVYLIHAPLLYLGMQVVRAARPGRFASLGADTWCAIAALTLMCLALSSATYRFIERPFLAWKPRSERDAIRPRDARGQRPVATPAASSRRGSR